MVSFIPAAPVPELDLFPNPFNPKATISWSRLGETPALLTVHDITGRHLGQISVPPNTDALTWNGRMGDRRLPSGLYLIRALNAKGELLATARAMMLK